MLNDRLRGIARNEIGVVVMMLVLHVHAQMTRTREDRFALLTDESLIKVAHGGRRLRLFAVHTLLMAPQVIVPREVLRAVVAVIRFQFAVHLKQRGEKIHPVMCRGRHRQTSKSILYQ